MPQNRTTLPNLTPRLSDDRCLRSGPIDSRRRPRSDPSRLNAGISPRSCKGLRSLAETATLPGAFRADVDSARDSDACYGMYVLPKPCGPTARIWITRLISETR